MSHIEKIAVYTCVTNNYDHIIPQHSEEDNVDFFFFTNDNNIKPSSWKITKPISPPRLTNGHDINRFHKFFPHQFLHSYRYSIYMDGNVKYSGKFHDLVEKLKDHNLALAAFSHPCDRSVETEANACMNRNRLDSHDREKIGNQLIYYKSDGFNLATPISENNLIIRDHHHPALPFTMSIWWSQLFEFSKRDQISLQYAIWKTQLPFGFIDLDLNINHSLLTKEKHKITLKQKTIKGFKRAINSITRRTNNLLRIK